MNQLKHNNKNNQLHILNSRENSVIYLEDDFCLTEEDFYPPSDDRILSTGVYHIIGDDSFEEYAEYIFNLYEEENYYEN